MDLGVFFIVKVIVWGPLVLKKAWTWGKSKS